MTARSIGSSPRGTAPGEYGIAFPRGCKDGAPRRTRRVPPETASRHRGAAGRLPAPVLAAAVGRPAQFPPPPPPIDAPLQPGGGRHENGQTPALVRDSENPLPVRLVPGRRVGVGTCEPDDFRVLPGGVDLHAPGNRIAVPH